MKQLYVSIQILYLNIHHGKNAISEPENICFREDENIKLNINHHDYGNAILYPADIQILVTISHKEEQCYKDICKFVTQKLSNYSYADAVMNFIIQLTVMLIGFIAKV